MLVAKLKARPFLLVGASSSLIQNYSGMESSVGYYSHGPLGRLMIRETVCRADVVLAISEHVAEQARALGARRIRTAYCGVDTDAYLPATSPGNARPFILTIVSELSHEYLRRKRIAPVIQAVGALRQEGIDLELKVIGRSGDAVESLRSLAADHSVTDRVHFLGVVSEGDKIGLLQQTAAYVQPTLHENFGVAIAEAMSCGRPVVSSPVGSVPEVIADCGLYAAADDWASMSEQLRRILLEPGLATRLGEAARRRALALFSVRARRAAIGSALLELDLVSESALRDQPSGSVRTERDQP
jgi:glycosyltransferase involved in cell wall biosynthesis